MKKIKLLTIFVLVFFVIGCAFTFSGCNETKANAVTDTVNQDTIADRVSFGKKYYWLGYDGYDENQYYTINENGTAAYTHVIKNGNTTTFHQIIHFKWTYAGDGNCILMHNGTKIVKGTQDDAFGITRVMHVAKDVVYWSASGENTYYINQDFVEQIPNYGKFVNN